MRRIASILILIGMVVCGAGRVTAEETARRVLDNGLTVIVSEMPSSPTVSVYGLVKTGSATEGKYLGTGISHFVEHMLFKGTAKRGLGAIAQEVKALGGTINAATSFDYTIYTLDVPKGGAAQAFDIIADMLMHSTFDPVEVNKEREVIFGEMRMINDRPSRKIGDLLNQGVYTRHPYRHPIIGYVPLFGRIKQEELVEYYKTRYVPNNMIMSIAGPVKADDVIPVIDALFKNAEPKPYPDRHVPAEPPQNFPRRFETEYPSEMFRFIMAYRGVSIFDSDMYALDLLAMILGNGESSRLYLDVFKQKGLVDTIDTSDDTPLDPGLFEISAETSKDSVDAAIAVIKADIAAIQKNGVTAEELEKVKHQVMSAKIFGRQTSPSVAYQNAVNEAFVGDYAFEEKYLQEIRRVTLEDIKRVAGKYLTDEHLTVVVLKPKTAKTKETTVENTGAGDIQRFVEPNGAKVLIKEDHTFPLVSINVAFNAGLRLEPEALNGLASLTADLWTKGTKKWSARQIAQMVEARGASLTGYSGYNSTGLRMDVLAEDLSFALDIIESCIKEPLFAAEEFAKQKQAVLAGIRQQQDSIFDVTLRHLRQTVFDKNPFRRQVTGTLESVGRIERKDVVEFYPRFAAPSNMVISVFGDLNGEAVKADLTRRFGKLSGPTLQFSQYNEPKPQELRLEDVAMDKEQAALMIGFRAPAMFDADRYGMELVSSILGSSLSGRIFVKVREELGGAYAVGANYTPAIDTGFMYFYVLTTEAQLGRVKEIVLKELQDLMDRPLSAQELNNAKADVKGDHAMSLDTVGKLASVTTLDELYGLGFANYREFDQRIDAVSADEIRRLVRTYLDPRRAGIVTTRPAAR